MCLLFYGSGFPVSVMKTVFGSRLSWYFSQERFDERFLPSKTWIIYNRILTSGVNVCLVQGNSKLCALQYLFHEINKLSSLLILKTHFKKENPACCFIMINPQSSIVDILFDLSPFKICICAVNKGDYARFLWIASF